MSYIKRSVDIFFQDWKSNNTRKPLLLRGPRQVGKTSSVRELGHSFKHYIELNFLFDKRAHKIFERDVLDPFEITEEISLLYGKPILDNDSLLFLDEVQACPAAIEALRFFYEKRQGLHVIAAGSLLEFALQELPSFGVGRIQSVYMQPLSFFEFLDALGKNSLRAKIEDASLVKPLSEILHNEALKQLKLYLMFGGLPEIVQSLANNSSSFTKASESLSSIILNYEDDFNKYRGRVPETRLRDCLRAVAQQAGKKFIYRRAYVDAISSQVHNACSLLEKAGLIVKVSHTSANGIPLGAEVDNSKFKYKIFDLGIYHKLLGLSLREAALEETATFVHRGALSELFVGNELLQLSQCTERGDIWYWHRESKSSTAELDYLVEINQKIIPIEVKAGTKGSMKSLRIFLEEKKLPLGLRVCAENFSRYENILVVPLYATGVLPKFL